MIFHQRNVHFHGTENYKYISLTGMPDEFKLFAEVTLKNYDGEFMGHMTKNGICVKLCFFNKLARLVKGEGPHMLMNFDKAADAFPKLNPTVKIGFLETYSSYYLGRVKKLISKYYSNLWKMKKSFWIVISDDDDYCQDNKKVIFKFIKLSSCSKKEKNKYEEISKTEIVKFSRGCAACKKSDVGLKHRFKICKRCKHVRYCSVECQKNDWGVHKMECKKYVVPKKADLEQPLEKQIKSFALNCALHEFVRVFCEKFGPKDLLDWFLQFYGPHTSQLYVGKPKIRKKLIVKKIGFYF